MVCSSSSSTTGMLSEPILKSFSRYKFVAQFSVPRTLNQDIENQSFTVSDLIGSQYYKLFSTNGIFLMLFSRDDGDGSQF